MADPLADLFKTSNLHSLKSVGYHLTNVAREKGEDTAKPMAFVGLVTIVIGVAMLMKAANQIERGRSR